VAQYFRPMLRQALALSATFESAQDTLSLQERGANLAIHEDKTLRALQATNDIYNICMSVYPKVDKFNNYLEKNLAKAKASTKAEIESLSFPEQLESWKEAVGNWLKATAEPAWVSERAEARKATVGYTA